MYGSFPPHRAVAACVFCCQVCTSITWQVTVIMMRFPAVCAGFGWGPVAEDAMAAATIRALFRLKGLVRDRRCAAMVTVPAGHSCATCTEFTQCGF